ncbi:MAG: GAF domain-containing protein [Bacteroidales bacterium]|nr:GAF domain-containing protein [Bacteroidales bacterium]MBR2477475.1 GAF domain-containing protein [Bacteroidales bacterium]
MAEQLIITAKDKAGIYAEILPQIEAVVSAETDMIANMANVSAILKEAFGFWWVGFYIVKPCLSGGEELVLGPFQGPLACTRIKKGRGVCGTSWEQAQTIIVPDVEQFPGHIACSSLSRSEIVVPVFASDGSVMGVLDIDSEHLATFDVVDKEWLEKMLKQINFVNK